MPTKKFNLKQQALRLVFWLADWVFPKECVGCGAEGAWLCARCHQRIDWQLYQTCVVCGADTGGRVCSSHHWALDKVLAAVVYDGAVKDLIKICKYHFSQEAAADLAALLVEAGRDRQWPMPQRAIVVPVPLTRRRYRWRGFNQAAILAQALAENWQLDYQAKFLLKIKNTKPQVSLTAEQRLHNLQTCFVWRGDSLSGKTILLIDDVATTGATLNECAKVLKAAGAAHVWGLVIAK